MPAKLPEKEKKELIERYSRGASVTALCKEKKISRVVFYRWLKQYKSTEEKKATVTINRKLSPEKRLEIITRVQAGEKVKQLCKSYGISRTIFYRLKKRYHAAPDEKKLDALANKKPVIKRYHKQAPIAYEQAVLNAVTLYPELSSHKLVHVLPAIQNKPILGNHGVANVLKRHNLSTYEKRLAYVTAEKNSYVLPLPDFYWFKELLTINTPLVKNRLFHLGIVIIAAIFSSIVFLGARALFNVTFLSTTTINYVMILPLLSLSAGMIFFLYSIKHYLSIAMVLGSDTKQSGGLLENLSHIQLQRRPFVSVHLAMYNERRVIERLLTAVTSFAYDDYEILVADDSTDPQAIAAW